MTARRISLGFLLAVTLAWAMDKDNLSVANDAQPVSDAHAQVCEILCKFTKQVVAGGRHQECSQGQLAYSRLR